MSLDHLARSVAAHAPRLSSTDGHRRAAATALILHDHPSAGPSALFVERTHRRGDRWSGQMALPGGRRDPGDVDLLATAVREAHEEVGVLLGPPAGRLDDVISRGGRAVVATFVFTVEDEPVLVPQATEVASTVWVPLTHLADAASATTVWHRGVGPFPAVGYDRYRIWGLTLRIVRSFLEIVGAEMRRDG